MSRIRSRWTRLALALAIGALSTPGAASAGSAGTARTPSRPAKEVVRAERAVQKMARQQEKASRATARVASPTPATTPRASGTRNASPSPDRSRSNAASRPRDPAPRGSANYSSSRSRSGAYGPGYSHSGSRYGTSSGYKKHSYSSKNYSKSSFSIGIGFSTCGSVGHVCTSACYGYRYGYVPRYRPSYRYGYGCGPSYRWYSPFWCYRPAFAYCPPTYFYGSYAYPSTGYGLTSVDYYPSGGGVTTWQDQSAGATGDYYAWQRETTATPPSQPAPAVASPEPGPLDGETAIRSPSGDLLADAWAALAAGDSKTAIGYFSTVADTAPELVQPKVGYAIAAASQGQIKPAAWSLRRAWTQSPDSIGYLPTDNGMIQRLDALAADLQRRAISGEGTVDLWFVAATVDYLRFQPAEAKAAADRARILGDQHPSLDALTRRLEADLVGR